MKISKKFGKKKSIRNILLIIIFIILAIGSYSIYWYILAGKIIKSIEEKKSEYIIKGYKIGSKSIDISGFPFWINITITDPMIYRMNNNLSWNWRGQELRVSARPWHLNQIEVGFPGRHLATLKSQYKNIELDLKIRNSKIFLKWATDYNFPIKVKAKLEDILYSSAPVLGLGRRTRSIVFLVELKGVPPSSFASAALDSWRNQGGTLEIQDIFFEHGPIEIKGEGTIALNKELRPLAAFNLEARGYLELIDRLQSSTLISPNDARLSKTILSMLAVSEKNRENYKSRKKVKFPLTVQDGYLYVGPINLGRIPELFWPSKE
jgi:hypothetical protein